MAKIHAQSWLQPEKINGGEGDQFRGIIAKLVSDLARLEETHAVTFHVDNAIPDGLEHYEEATDKLGSICADAIEEVAKLCDSYRFVSKQEPLDREFLQEIIDNRLGRNG